MYAIVSIAGQQFKVEEGQEIFVHRLAANAGDEVKFDQLLLVGRDSGVTVGTPTIAGHVSAEVIDHVKGDKVLVFKKKRRKGYQKLNGHRQFFTKLKINSINS